MTGAPSAVMEGENTTAPGLCVDAGVLASQQRRERWRRWTKRLATFFAGQGAVQLLNLLNGFFLIRCLSISDYAVLSLVTGFQGAVTVLMDVGLGGAIVALLAGRTDPKVVGSHIRSTRHFRDRIFLILLPIVSIAFGYLALQQGLTWPLIVLLLGSILTTLYFESWSSYYSVPFMVHQELGSYFRTPTLLGALRLGVNGLLYLFSSLTSLAAAWSSALAVLVQGWFFKRQSARYIEEPKDSDPVINRNVFDYIRPQIPSTVFFALQGQISILLVSCFGDVRSLAEVGALGRLAQLFVMLGAFNAVIIAPTIARIPRVLLPRRYVQMLAGAAGVALGLMGASIFFPQWMLWVLGKQYLHLENELAWMTGSACLSYLAGVMWTMHSARKWIFRWSVWSYIVTGVLTQIVGILVLDLSTARNVLILGAASAFAALAVQIAVAVYGFFLRDRNADDSEAILADAPQ